MSIDEGRRCWSKDTLALAPWVAVLSRCHPSRRPFESANPETAAGDVLPVHDPGHFAIDPDLFHVVAATVAGDLEDFVHQAFRLAFSRKPVSDFLLSDFTTTPAAGTRRLIGERYKQPSKQTTSYC